MDRKRWNWRLIVGGTATVALVLVAIAGSWLAPYPDTYNEKIAYEQTAAGPRTVYPPRPPSREHLLGTDRWGYDILSLLLYGAKFTLFTVLGVALLRTLLGAGLGLGLGIRGSPERQRSNKRRGLPGGLGALGAVPAFVAVWFVMIRINISSPLPSWELVLIEATLLIALGIPAVAAMVRARTEDLRETEWATAARAAGATRRRVAGRHILPMLKEDLVLVAINEVLLVLALIGQLGIFGLFLGGTILYIEPITYVSRTHEWAGLIGQARASLQANQWMLLGPLAAYVTAVLAFYLLLRGLEQRYRAGYYKYPNV